MPIRSASIAPGRSRIPSSRSVTFASRSGGTSAASVVSVRGAGLRLFRKMPVP
jgi:hypothetical protein